MFTVSIRDVFAQALKELLADRNIQYIQVKEIAEKSGLSSRSFYNYFKDKYDLAHYIYYCMNESCWFQDGELLSFTEATCSFGMAVHENRTLLKRMYAYTGQNDIRSFVVEKTCSDIRRLILASGRAELLDEPRTEQIIKLISYALSGTFEYDFIFSRGSGVESETLIDCVPSPWKTILLAGSSQLTLASGMRVFERKDCVWPPVLY